MILFQSTKKNKKNRNLRLQGPKLPKINEKKKKTRLKLSNISLLPYLYCNIDLNLLHNYCCHHISRNDFVQLFKCTFQKNKKIIKKAENSTILLKWNLIHFIILMAIFLCTTRQSTTTTTPKITCDSISIDKKNKINKKKKCLKLSYLTYYIVIST